MRTFTNNGPSAVQFPTLGVEIAPGATADVDLPAKVACPEMLLEVTKKAEAPKATTKSEAA